METAVQHVIRCNAFFWIWRMLCFEDSTLLWIKSQISIHNALNFIHFFFFLILNTLWKYQFNVVPKPNLSRVINLCYYYYGSMSTCECESPSLKQPQGTLNLKFCCFWRPLWTKSAGAPPSPLLNMLFLHVLLFWQWVKETCYVFKHFFFFNTAVCRKRSVVVFYLWLCKINNCNMMMEKLCFSAVTDHRAASEQVSELS